MKMFRTQVILSFVLVLLLTAPVQVSAGDLKGKVILTKAADKSAAGGLSSFYRRPAAENRSGDSGPEVVAFLKSFNGQKKPTPVENARLVQRNEDFEPHTLVVTVGSTVGFPNMDSIYHNVFSFSKAKTFDLGRYAQGKTKTVTFDKPGIVEIFCEIHSNMKATIVVVPNDYYAVVSKNGNFLIPDIPPGKYTLGVWRNSFDVKEYEITIPVDGDADITIEF